MDREIEKEMLTYKKCNSSIVHPMLFANSNTSLFLMRRGSPAGYGFKYRFSHETFCGGYLKPTPGPSIMSNSYRVMWLVYRIMSGDRSDL